MELLASKKLNRRQKSELAVENVKKEPKKLVKKYYEKQHRKIPVNTTSQEFFIYRTCFISSKAFTTAFELFSISSKIASASNRLCLSYA
jgi:hypothetical protein